MSAKGYITHAAESRRFAGLLLVYYVLAFQLTGAIALTFFLMLFDPEHMIFTDPAGYAVRYALPIALISALGFCRLYRGHADAVASSLDVRTVMAAEEPRFVRVAEQACTNLGIRFPRFGVIETPELNALTMGEGPSAGLMVATRGLLDSLDDDELAAVFAHEASHIRNGDTRVLAANHALMRTAVLWQLNNPLRIEDWRQVIAMVLLPPLLVLFLAGGATTMLSLKLARFARRGIKLSRDHVADGEAVRVTHFPEALLSALRKVSGRGTFPGSARVEALLFDGPADHEGGSHPAAGERLTAIEVLGKGLLDPSRSRRDTRVPLVSGPHHRSQHRSQGRTLYPADNNGRPLQQPPTPTFRLMALRFTDPEAFRQWQQAMIAWWEWRTADGRNMFGIAPKMVIPVAAACVFAAIFWWPRDNDPAKFAATFSPSAFTKLAEGMNSGMSTDLDSSPKPVGVNARPVVDEAEIGDSDALPGFFFFVFIVGMMLTAVFRPSLLKRMAGVVDATPEQLGARLNILSSSASPDCTEPTAMPKKVFGRKHG